MRDLPSEASSDAKQCEIKRLEWEYTGSKSITADILSVGTPLEPFSVDLLRPYQTSAAYL